MMYLIFYKVDNEKEYDQHTFDNVDGDKALEMLEKLPANEYKAYEITTGIAVTNITLADFVKDYNNEELDGGWWSTIIDKKVKENFNIPRQLSEAKVKILNKEFKVNEHFSITRDDYESFPCAMIAFNWSDEEMEKLAKQIEKELAPYDEEYAEGCEEDFWATMENVAVRMGMQYYEDLTDEEEEKINEEWENLG
jgi:hypothetical protein